MKLIVYITLLIGAATTFAHEGHGDDAQMPLDYVKFPYQAQYPGDDTGFYL